MYTYEILLNATIAKYADMWAPIYRGAHYDHYDGMLTITASIAH